ncbi:MAG: hypothetical protein HRU77_04250 [Gammaproteobacteria bacterium]|nr:MAG: hypothetical protein HRU77_04250 [Gammaproteobacteria bacterium]
MRPPKLIKPYVISFARQVVGGDASPFYVPCSPLYGAPQNECFSLVESQVSIHGGAAVLGWAIWERPKVFIEAEFHAIWRAPDGNFLDLSPRPVRVPRILFVHDHRRKHNRTQVNNIRKPLAKDKDVDRFLRLADEFFRLLNEGNLKHHLGEFPVTPKMYAKMRTNRNEAAILEQKLLNRYGPWSPEE